MTQVKTPYGVVEVHDDKPKKKVVRSYQDEVHKARLAKAKAILKKRKENETIRKARSHKLKKGYGILGLKKKSQGHKLSRKSPIRLI